MIGQNMNKRIEELAEQSGLDIYGLGLDWNKWDTAVSKFAELIVRECAEICMIEYDTGLDMAPRAPWLAKQIKDHFGVGND